MKRTAPLLAIAGVALAGCSVFSPLAMTNPSPSPTPYPAANCTPGHCKFTVTPVGCGGTAQVVSADPIVVQRGGHGPIVIQWDLVAPAGWRFDHVGIEIEQGTLTEFHSPSHGAQKVTWVNKHATQFQFHYFVNLVSPTGQSCRWDPTVMN